MIARLPNHAPSPPAAIARIRSTPRRSATRHACRSPAYARKAASPTPGASQGSLAPEWRRTVRGEGANHPAVGSSLRCGLRGEREPSVLRRRGTSACRRAHPTRRCRSRPDRHTRDGDTRDAAGPRYPVRGRSPRPRRCPKGDQIDFLFLGTARGNRFDKKATGIKALREGLKIIDEEMEDKFVLHCGGPALPMVGYASVFRVGPDVGNTWKNEAINGTSSSMYHAQRSTWARAWMDGKWYTNDPDCIINRKNNSGLTDEERKSWLTTELACIRLAYSETICPS